MELTRTPDGMGGHTRSWTERARTYARVVPMSAGRVTRMGHQVGEITHDVAFREHVPVTTRDRLRIDAAALDLDVVAVLEQPGHAPTVFAKQRDDQIDETVP